MKHGSPLCLCASLLACAISFLPGCKPAPSEGLLSGPTTVEQAAQLIDLSAFPVMEGSAPASMRTLATLTYAVPKATVKSAYDFQRDKLTAQGWKESTRDSSVTEQAASGTFKRKGFALSVSAYPAGPDAGITVSLNNHGNISYGDLPKPGGIKPIYVGDATAMYVTDATVPATALECRKLLLARGWQPYGSAGDSNWFKQNAVRLNVTVSSAPAQGGKTVISYSGELMSADLPAPEDAEDLRYSDATRELSFESGQKQNQMVEFYKQTLARTHWEPTLAKTVEIDERPTMIFRNPGKDMLTLSFSSDRRGKAPVSLQYQSAAEIAELERAIKAKAPQIKAELQRREAKAAAEYAEAHKPSPKVQVTMPSGAHDFGQSAGEIRFTVNKGEAKAVAAMWRKQFVDAGWKEDVATLESMVGAISLSKGQMNLTIQYTDTGFTPPEVNISANGAELEASRADPR